MAGSVPPLAGWRTSSYCSNYGCVAVKITPEWVLVRHSNSGVGGLVLSFDHDEWKTFLDGVRDGEFDVPADITRNQENPDARH